MSKVLVTGAGKGLGKTISEFLRSSGHEVFTCARSGEVTVHCDVTSEKQVERMRQEIGPVEVLINNAGGVRTAPFLKISEADWDWHFELNIKSVYYCTRAFLPAMLENHWGRIIQIASIAGKIGTPYITAYTATKHAMIGFTRSLAQEVGSKGVTVNAVCPSFVDTPMLRESLQGVSAKTGKSVEEIVETFRNRNPEKRLMKPEEVAQTVKFLIDNAAINGQAISVCGGETFS
jgi:NAD(P)-dependent dehydrogenase (short-subunit alcohol dehydrogenase family)